MPRSTGRQKNENNQVLETWESKSHEQKEDILPEQIDFEIECPRCKDIMELLWAGNNKPRGAWASHKLSLLLNNRRALFFYLCQTTYLVNSRTDVTRKYLVEVSIGDC